MQFMYYLRHSLVLTLISFTFAKAFEKRQLMGRNKLLIYDPLSGRQMDPMDYLPIKFGNKRKQSQATGNLIELPQLWNPCACSDNLCACCLGISWGQPFNHRFCLVLEYNSVDIGLLLKINHNQKTIANFNFSARNPPPYCIPILVPLPLFTCLRVYDIQADNGNVRLCLTLVLNVFQNQIFEYKFNCVRFGVNGIEFHQPDRDIEPFEETFSNNQNIFHLRPEDKYTEIRSTRKPIELRPNHFQTTRRPIILKVPSSEDGISLRKANKTSPLSFNSS